MITSQYYFMIPVKLFIVPRLDLGNPKDKEFFETQILAKGPEWADHYLSIEETKVEEKIIPVYLFEDIEFSEPPFEKSGKIIKEKYQIIKKLKDEVSGKLMFYGYKISSEVISK